MERDLRLFGPLRDRFGTNRRKINAENSQTVRALLIQLDIEPTLVKVAIDGTICDLDCEIGNAVEIAILPPVSGG